MGTHTADPSINVRPGPMSIEVAVRYIIRANARHALRSKLYQAVVHLLGREASAAWQPPEPPAAAGRTA